MPKCIVGECSACGQCCKTLALPVPHANAWRRPTKDAVLVARQAEIAPSMRAFLTTHGVTVYTQYLRVPVDPRDGEPVKPGTYRGVQVLFIRSRCKQLAEDNRCKVHGTEKMPATCRTYPTVLDDLSVVPDCSYRVVEDA